MSRQNWDFWILIETSRSSRLNFWNCQDFLDRWDKLLESVENKNLDQVKLKPPTLQKNFSLSLSRSIKLSLSLSLPTYLTTHPPTLRVPLCVILIISSLFYICSQGDLLSLYFSFSPLLSVYLSLSASLSLSAPLSLSASLSLSSPLFLRLHLPKLYLNNSYVI